MRTLLKPLHIPVNSHVALVQKGGDVDEVLLQDVYKTAIQGEVSTTPLVKWNSGNHLYTGPKRNNYGGTSINCSVLVSIDLELYIYIYIL